jgi:streptomycin 6-kinase
MIKIKQPAIKTKDGKVFTGGKDHQAIIDSKNVKGERGFNTTEGKFVNREVAAKIANKEGQTDRPVKKLFSHQLKRKP